MKFKAIFLDVDGVLVDSEKVFNACWRQAAEEEGYVMSFEQALELRSLDSTLAKDLFNKWYGNGNAYPAIRQRRKVIMAERNKTEKLEGKPGVVQFLQALKELPIKVNIVTSSPVSRITEYLGSVGIDIALFDDVITTEQVKRGKPFPDVYEYACGAIGCIPVECVAVEDSPNGVKSAHGAGCYTIMVPDLSAMTDEIKDYVDAVAEDLMGVVNVIK